jgi:hypothetical protein
MEKEKNKMKKANNALQKSIEKKFKTLENLKKNKKVRMRKGLKRFRR